MIAVTNVAVLNALNGNGLLQQTVLNRQLILMRDWGSDFGVKWDTERRQLDQQSDRRRMLYSTHQDNDQSGVAPVLNDVVNQSNIYDVVAMNGAGGVLGYADQQWPGQLRRLGRRHQLLQSDLGVGVLQQRVHLEPAPARRFRPALGTRAAERGRRQQLEPADSAPACRASINPTPTPSTERSTYTEGHETPTNYTFGVNYTLSPSTVGLRSLRARLPDSGGQPEGTAVILSEAGVTYSGFGFAGTVRGFRTLFDNQSCGGGVDPANPNLNLGFFGNSDHQRHRFRWHLPAAARSVAPVRTARAGDIPGPEFNNVSTGTITINNVNVSAQANAFYNGKTPGRTPNVMYTITPQSTCRKLRTGLSSLPVHRPYLRGQWQSGGAARLWNSVHRSHL